MSLTYSLLRSLGVSGVGAALMVVASLPVRTDPVSVPPPPPPLLAAPKPLAARPEKTLPTAADLAKLMIRRGTPTLDLDRDAHARLGDQRRDETATQIQAAIDAFAFPGLPEGRKTIMIAGTYYIDRPLFLDVSNLSLVGDGTGTITSFSGSSVFYVGIPRTPLGKQLTPDHIYDLYGVLDAEAAPGPGQRWGLRFHGDSHLAFASAGLGLAADSAAAITIEYGIDTSESGNRIGPIVGLAAHGEPAPWQVFRMDDYRGGTRTAVMFRTEDGTTHLAYVADPEPGVHRTTIQIDTATATLRAWIDGEAATVDASGLGAWTPGANLARNENVIPIKINSCGPKANLFGSDWWSYDHPILGGLDFGLVGLHVSRVARYRDQDHQERCDGQAITDAGRYFTKDQNTVGLLPLDQPPVDLIANRSVRSLDQGYFGVSHGLLLSDTHGSEWTAVVGDRLTGLRISNYGGWENRFGEAVTLGFSLHLRIKDCALEGGQHGLGTWQWGTNYLTRCHESSFAGNDAAISSYYGMLELTDCESPSNGKYILRLNISSAKIHGFFAGDGGAARMESYIRASESVVDLDGFASDNESGDGPSRAVFDLRTGSQGGTPNGGFFQAHNLNLAAPRAAAPVFLLDGDPGDNPGILEVSGRLLIHGVRTAPLVQVQRPGSWSVSLDLNPSLRIDGQGTAVKVASPSVD